MRRDRENACRWITTPAYRRSQASKGGEGGKCRKRCRKKPLTSTRTQRSRTTERGTEIYCDVIFWPPLFLALFHFFSKSFAQQDANHATGDLVFPVFLAPLLIHAIPLNSTARNSNQPSDPPQGRRSRMQRPTRLGVRLGAASFLHLTGMPRRPDISSASHRIALFLFMVPTHWNSSCTFSSPRATNQ